MVLLFDKMKVQEDLVWDKKIGMILCRLAGILQTDYWKIVKRLYFNFQKEHIIYVNLFKRCSTQSVYRELPKFPNSYLKMVHLDTRNKYYRIIVSKCMKTPKNFVLMSRLFLIKEFKTI